MTPLPRTGMKRVWSNKGEGDDLLRKGKIANRFMMSRARNEKQVKRFLATIRNRLPQTLKVLRRGGKEANFKEGGQKKRFGHM